MDTTTLAREVIRLLVPALPYLQAVGSKALEGAGTKLGEEVWARSKTLWGWLKERLLAQEDAKEAVADLVAKPDDAEASQALSYKLRKLFEKEPALAMQIAELVANSAPVQEIELVQSEAEALLQESSSGRGKQVIKGDRSKVKGIVQSIK
jgi:hypothetical protein